MMFHIRINVAPDVADAWQTLSVRLPALARGQQVADYVIRTDRSGVCVVIRDDLASRQFKVVADGWVGVREVLSREAVRLRQTI